MDFGGLLLRKNLILKDGRYNFAEVVGLFACCLGSAGPGVRIFLCRARILIGIYSQSFTRKFMSLDGWGLTNDFMQAYPELNAEGLDTGSVCYELN